MPNNYTQVFNRRKLQLLKTNPELAKKYNHAGIYSITINGELVYIGKAKNMLKRIVEHILAIEQHSPKENKYKVLKCARDNHYNIQFDVMYYAKSKNAVEIETEIGVKEGELIRKYLPPLNTQIPKVDNYKSYSVNKKALSITLDEVLTGKGVQL